MTIEEKYREKCATPSDINQHLPTLRRYAERCRHVTEMGVRTIVSTWAFLAAKPIDGVVSIDYIHPADHGGNINEVYDAIRQDIFMQVIWIFIKADTRTMEIEPTDLLFIDTWHVYEQLKIELERHAGQVRKYIILHDTTTFAETGETAGHRGLKPALDEFLAGTKDWFVLEEFANCNGLMILERRA